MIITYFSINSNFLWVNFFVRFKVIWKIFKIKIFVNIVFILKLEQSITFLHLQKNVLLTVNIFLGAWPLIPHPYRKTLILFFLQIPPMYFLGCWIICTHLGFAFAHVGEEIHLSPHFNHQEDYRVCKGARCLICFNACTQITYIKIFFAVGFETLP